MLESADLMTRIDRLCLRASDARSAEPLLGEMESLLDEGYLEALTGDARSRRLAERLERLVEILDEPEAAVEARRTALRKRGVDDKVSVLRGRLELLREHFVRLRGHSRFR
ncbi:MAG: hypothetical protein M3O90_06670 [Actinomycetota bacterium]|nr:hypothetical protein [Actinomycetota bacterium]